jgi:hypothetical protein
VTNWRKKNSYYYNWITKILKFALRDDARVLHIGSEGGEVLADVKAKYAVGVEADQDFVELARSRHEDIKFVNADPHDFDLEEKFDFIIISNGLGYWTDIQKVFDCAAKHCTEKTRVIVLYYNYMWEPLLKLGSKLGLRRPLPYQNWLSPKDIGNLLDLSNFEVVRSDSFVTMPLYIPLVSAFCNYILSILPLFSYFNLVNMYVARPIPEPGKEEDYSISVIIPCRNERGNILAAIERVPQMGKDTEIIFVDGNSTDGTADEIKAQIEKHPDRNIKFIDQGSGIGKGDAVRKGFDQAAGDILVIQDADLTAMPEELPKFFKAAVEGKGEFINGSRLVYPMEKEAMRFLNLLGNKFFSCLFTWLLGQRFKDTLCGTKMISKSNYELIAANRSYFGDFDPFGDFDLIFGAVKQNFKVTEIPLVYKARTYGETNISRFRHGWLLLKMSWFAFKKIKWLGGSK